MSNTYDLPMFYHEDTDPRQPLDQMPDRKIITIDVNEFIRSRDALGTAYSELASSLDRAVKAYIDHTNVVLAGDTSLNISLLTQPFNQLASTAQQALMQGHGMLPMNPIPGPAAPALAHGQLHKDGRVRRAYKKRDPNAPKRPLTAYFRYLQEQRHNLKDEMAAIKDGPGKPGDISKLATEKWNAMTEAQQKPYRDQYQADLQDYEKAVSEFKGTDFKIKKLSRPALEPLATGEDYELMNAEYDEDAEGSVDSGSGAPDDPPTPTLAKAPKAQKDSAAVTASPESKRKGPEHEEAPAKKRGRKAKADLVPATEPEQSNTGKQKKNKKT